jgi:hypothetical protein
MLEEKIEPNQIIETVLKADEIISPLVDDDLITMAMSLGINQVVFGELYQVIRDRGTEISHQVMMGPLVEATFDWTDNVASLQVGPYKKELKFEQLLKFMGLIDAVYAPVYPLGTILKIKQGMLPEQWQTMFSNQDELLVMVVGRKQELQNDFADYLFDYITVLWPLGVLPNVEPISISNLMIDRVIALGHTDELEKEMAEKVLKASQLANKQISSAFMPDDIVSEYLASIGDL